MAVQLFTDGIEPPDLDTPILRFMERWKFGDLLTGRMYQCWRCLDLARRAHMRTGEPRMKFHITAEDVQFAERDFRELQQRLEAAFNCDGVVCQAPCAPHDPMTPHFHLVLTAPDLR